MGFSIQPIR